MESFTPDLIDRFGSEDDCIAVAIEEISIARFISAPPATSTTWRRSSWTPTG